MFRYEFFTFGPVVSLGHHTADQALVAGDVLHAARRWWQVERVVSVEGSDVPRLICVEPSAIEGVNGTEDSRC